MKRASGFVGFLCGAVVATLLTILFGRGRSPDFARGVVPVSPAETALNRTLDHVEIDHLTLSQAIAALSAQAHIPIKVHIEVQASAGFDTEKLSLHAGQVTLAQALRDLLDLFEIRGGANLTVWPDGGTVQIGDPNDSARVAVYDTRDFDLDPSLLATEAPVYPPNSQMRDDPPRAMDHLISIITTMVAPDSWRDSGGSIGSIRAAGPRLVVLESWENQQKLRRLLDDLSRTPHPAERRAVPLALPSTLRVWDAALQQFISEPPTPAELALRSELKDVDIEPQPAEKAIPALSRLAGIDIVVDWEALRHKGFQVYKPVSLRASRTALNDALRGLLDQLSNSDEHFTFQPDRNSIQVSDQILSISRIYDLGDQAGRLVPDNRDSQSHAVGGQDRQTAQDQRWTDLIVSNASTLSWFANGGDECHITIFGQKLAVQETWSNQEAVERFLTDLLRTPNKPPATQPAGR